MGGARLYRSFATESRSRQHQKMVVNERNQISEVKEFSAFLCMDVRVGL